MEPYKIFARNQKCHSASELGLGRIYFFCQMPICRIIWLFLVGYRISGRIIRQCRISGSTLLLNRGFTYLPAWRIHVDTFVGFPPFFSVAQALNFFNRQTIFWLILLKKFLLPTCASSSLCLISWLVVFHDDTVSNPIAYLKHEALWCNDHSFLEF